MLITVQLPDAIGAKLKNKSAELNIAVADLLSNWVSQRLNEENSAPTLIQVVAQIKSTPVNENLVKHPDQSLADLLASTYPENFNSDQWDRDWAMIEADLKQQYRTDEKAENKN